MHLNRLASPFACALLAMVATAPLAAQISLQITVGPPPIPVYEQPVLPEDGYVWTPGYWAWGEDGYFWVPGTWVEAPEQGLLWTPGYWGWDGDYFEFHSGYWGTHVGFYGGINYGYGYGGSGFDGGYWQGRNYYYNRSVTNVNVTRVTYVYNRTVIVNNNTYVAYNGPGGVMAAPTPRERNMERERHLQPTSQQTRQHQIASRDRELRVSVNRGRPPVAATARPADFSARSVVAARAPGGRVEPVTLTATPKNQPPPGRGRAPEARPPGPAAAPAPERRPVPVPAPAPERRPVPAPAPVPERRPMPAPTPPPQRRPEPGPQRRPEPAPAPERRPMPAPPAQRRPEPSPAPDHERPPAPAPHPGGKKPQRPDPREGLEPKQRPEPPAR